MSFRKTFSGVKKDIKGLFRGNKRNKDRKGPGTSAEGADLEESLSRSESPFLGGSDRDLLGGSGSNPVGGHISLAECPAQQDKSDPVPAGGGKTSQGEGEGDLDQIEPSQAQRPLPHSNVEAVVGGGRGEKAGQVPSDTLILDRTKPDDPIPVPDYTQKDLHLEVSTELAAVTDEKRSDWKSTAFATAKLLLRGVRDTADAFGPLKSVAGGLCFILENCERTKANGEGIKSLAPRVRALSDQLYGPIPEGDIKEQKRREKLEGKLKNVLQELQPLEKQGKVEGFFTNVENADKLAGLV